MFVKIDHTSEVEKRIAAIHICSWDSCTFYERRESALVNLRQCVYCAYGFFEEDNEDIQQQGLCQYKRNRRSYNEE